LTVRLVVAVMLALLLAFLAVRVGAFLHDTDNTKIALVAETESYAARSRLVRRIDAMIAVLRDVHDYWEAYAALPAEEWPAFQGVALDELSGLERLLWIDEASGRQLLRTRRQPALNVAPGEDQRAYIEALRRDAAGVSGEVMLGPYRGDDGHRIRIVINRADSVGMLIAELRAPTMFAEFLRDESTGYAVTVGWRDEILFERGAVDEDVHADWTRDGMVRTSLGSVLKIVHTPTTELAESMVTPALAAVLPLGFAVAGLFGLLVFENGRVNVRVKAARRAALQITELNRGLEGQVAERTEELASRNADLVTISESVTHDLRNPLNAISINLALINQRLGEQLDEEERDAFDRITSSVSSMAEILQRVVGLSLAAHSTFEPEMLSMETLVTEVFEQLQSVEPPPAAALELGELPDVEADDTLVRILVLNVLGNSLRHTRDKDPRRIGVSGRATSETEVTFCIRDNGSGLDPAEAARIFAPFEQSATQPNSEGLGLGLTIAERIVKRHGGRIWAEGTKGEGAAIYFTLGHGANEPAGRA